jgi:hypothetical protein
MKKILSLSSLFFALSLHAQNVGINATGATPDNSAMLDVQSTNKGLLIPRVSLTGVNDAATIPSPATSLLVYNTNASLTNGVGFYYNSGTPGAPQWTKLLSASETLWREQTNYVELIPNKALYFPNNVGVGISSPAERLHVADGNIKLGNAVWTAGNDRMVKFGDADYVRLGEAGEDDVMQLFAKYFWFRASGSYSGNVGIGTTAAPTAKLEINGNLKITDGTQGAGKVLTSDASGTATWTAPVNRTNFRAISSGSQSVASNNTSYLLTGLLDDYDVDNSFFGGTFTAPATGAYHFDAKAELTINNANIPNYSRVYIQLYKNGSLVSENVYHIPNTSTVSYFQTLAINENLQLLAGDQISLRYYGVSNTLAPASIDKVVFSGYRTY